MCVSLISHVFKTWLSLLQACRASFEIDSFTSTPCMFFTSHLQNINILIVKLLVLKAVISRSCKYRFSKVCNGRHFHCGACFPTMRFSKKTYFGRLRTFKISINLMVIAYFASVTFLFVPTVFFTSQASFTKVSTTTTTTRQHSLLDSTRALLHRY